MSTRVLILEPDQVLLESFTAHFSHFTEFDVRYTVDVDECISLIRSFRPDVLLLEPALPTGAAETILECVAGSTEGPVVPVLVLTNRPNWIDDTHSSIHELHVKPQSLRLIADRIRTLAQKS